MNNGDNSRLMIFQMNPIGLKYGEYGGMNTGSLSSFSAVSRENRKY